MPASREDPTLDGLPVSSITAVIIRNRAAERPDPAGARDCDLHRRPCSE